MSLLLRTAYSMSWRSSVDIGAPGPGQVLVEVQAAGVNPTNTRYTAALVAATLPSCRYVSPEAAGQVKAVGEGARDRQAFSLHPGDEVIAYPVQGAYATELVARLLSAEVAGGPPGRAGGLMLTGVTAFLHAGRPPNQQATP